MPKLPEFNSDLRVTPESGREDKIELSLETWVLHGSTTTLDEIREYISAPPEHLRASLSAAESACYGWIFNRSQQPGAWRSPLKIRKADLQFADSGISAPLFSGEWFFQFSGSADNAERTIPTKLFLSLNALRYVRHNAGPRPLPSATAENWPAPNLKKRNEQPQHYGEFSLDGKDNWLPDSTYFSAWANDERWQRHLREYVRGVGDALTAELDRVTSQHFSTYDFHEDFRLQKVETAWEFATTEPIDLVRSLVPHLQAFNDLQTATTHYRPETEKGIVNSPSIKIALGANSFLRLYAKTNRRIRFEIIQEEINHRELLNEPPTSHGHQPTRPWERIFDCLAALRVRAAEKLNVVLEYLAQRTRIPPSHVSGFSLLIKITHVLQSSSLAHTVVSLLLNGAITPRNAGEELLTACRSLAKAGILAYDRRRRVYDAIAPYDHPLAMLRTIPQGRLLTRTRQRTRAPQN